MDNFKLEHKWKVNRKSLVWNFLTVLVLLGVCCLAYYFLSIFNNPYLTIANNPKLPLNPFRPATAVPTLTLYQTETSTPTIIPLEATWTPTRTTSPVPSRTKAASSTLVPQLITPPITSTPTITPTQPTPTVTSTLMLVSAVITYQASTDFHPDKNCDWLGVAGKVLGTDGKPLQFMEIQMGGILDGKPISYLTLSGTASSYGPSGFELVLGDHPVVSTQTLWIQLLDNKASPLTNKIYIDTYDGCNQNLVMVVFTKTR